MKKIFINAMKSGKTINMFLNGRMIKKVCETEADAKELFTLVIKVKENPTQEGMDEILASLNENTHIAMKCGLQTDPQTGLVYMAGFNTPVPPTLVEIIEEYHENGYPMQAIENFWKLLMLNPDKRVRTSLFDFIKTHDFVLTDSGYMVVYKAVDRVNPLSVLSKEDREQIDFVVENYTKVRKEWSCSARKYVVYKDEEGILRITKAVTADGWDLEVKDVEILGNLDDMYKYVEDLKEAKPEYPYESKYNGAPKMKIKLGEPVKQERKDCDADPARDCSNGLHCGATKYVESFGSWNGKSTAVLACYVNPAHVVAVPDYDHSKFRTSEYYPFAEVKYENQVIEIINQAYFESDYTHYEQEELEKMVAAIKAEEKPIQTAKSATEEDRPLEERFNAIMKRIREDEEDVIFN